MLPRQAPVLAICSFALVLIACLLGVAPARAAPLLDSGRDATDDALEERLADGDLDLEDHAALGLERHAGASDLHGASWVSLVAFERELLGGRRDVGGIGVVGPALDRIPAGSLHRNSDPPGPSPPPPPQPHPPRRGSETHAALT